MNDLKLLYILLAFLGILFLCIIINLIVISSKKLKYIKKTFSPWVKYKWTSSLSYEVLYNSLLTSLDSLGFINIKNHNKNLGEIIAATKTTLWSSGERISIKINKSNNEVTIISKPVIKTTIMDYGKGLENIDKILITFHQKTKN